MSMSKKDFILIADKIKENKHKSLLEIMIEAFSQINPRFKKDRWIDYINGLCGPNGGKIKVDKPKQK